MKIRNPFVLRLAGFLASWVIRAWVGTLTYRLALYEPAVFPADWRRQRFIYAFWHEAMLFPTGLRARVSALISQHADGELIAQVVRGLRGGVVRGSTTRGGTRALWQMLDAAQRSHLLVTPDGPRGPRRRLQPGIIFLASQTGLPIVPCGVAYAQCWRAPSWDRFAVPMPWTVAYGVAEELVYVPPGLGKGDLEYYRMLVEQRMLWATEAAEQWARGGGRPVFRREELRERRSA